MDQITAKEFDSLLSSGQKAIVLFYASWCAFCQGFKPTFKSAKISKKYRVFEVQIDEDENPLWDRFSIKAVPTVIAFDKGKIIGRCDAKLAFGLTRNDLDSMLKTLK